jgi:hypothetical protein
VRSWIERERGVSVPKENMKAIQCGNCEVLVPLMTQYPVRGVQTFEYHCGSCHGKVHLQLAKDPGTGQVVAKHVRLTGSPDEFRPNPIRPHHQVQIPVAYTLGAKSGTTNHVPVAPIKPPPPAYTLGHDQREQEFHPNHPMHPMQIRRRLQAFRY